jgi:TM2 domain-containing membrane protein YozV
MLIATFGPSTGWVGKTIGFENDKFVLQDHGPISASDVMDYDQQGHLVWATDGGRAWVGSKTQAPAAPLAVATVAVGPPAAFQPAVLAQAQTYAPLVRWDGQPLPPDFVQKKVAAGICGILLGAFGIHKFILGYAGEGVTMLVITLVSFALSLILIGVFGVMAMAIIGFIEGIIYLTKSDQEFVTTYGVHKRGWF